MEPQTNPTSLPMIGWREWLALPDLAIPGIKAKADTGARTSSLHTHDYRVERRGEEDWVVFHLHPLPHREDVTVTCQARVHGFREVKDSGGHLERRPFLRTRVVLGSCTWEISLNLTNREEMKFRMLLGREALAGRFWVNPARSYLTGTHFKHPYGRRKRRAET